MRRSMFAVLALSLAVLMVGLASGGAFAKDAPRISQEVLKALLDNPEVTVIDVRRGSDYLGSSNKIRAAVRESEKDISWMAKYPKDKFLVLY
jgi:rhodanese-related sulfurtransferase